MTTATQTAQPAPEWQKFFVSHTGPNEICLVDADGNPEHYNADCAVGSLAPGNEYEFLMVGYRIKAWREITVHTPIEPSKIEIGDVSYLNETTIRIGSYDHLHINGVILGDIKIGTRVNAKVQGNKLVAIEIAQTPATTTPHLAEDQTALKSIHLEDEKPHVILLNLKGEFRKYVEKEAIEKVKQIQPGKLIRYSTNKEVPGNPIKDIWEVDETGKSLKPRGGSKGGGGYRPDPQIELIRNLSILHEAVLDKALDLIKYGREHQWSDTLIKEGWALTLELTKKGSADLYQEIEKKHKYQGGHS